MILAAAALVGLQTGLTVKLAGKAPGVKPLAYAAAPTGSKFAVSIEGNDVRIMDANGRKLSKSTRATGLRELRAQGLTARDIRRLTGLD